MRLDGFIIRMYHDARSSECEMYICVKAEQSHAFCTNFSQDSNVWIKYVTWTILTSSKTSRRKEGTVARSSTLWYTAVQYLFWCNYTFNSIPFPTALQPGVCLGLLQSFLHPSRVRATTVQFLHPSFAASSFTPSSQRNLGLPLGRFPPGSLRTLLDKSLSSCHMTCPAHLILLNLQNFTMSFSPHNWKGSWLLLIRHLPHQSLGHKFSRGFYTQKY